MSQLARTNEEAFKYAEEHDLDVIQSAPDRLLLDLDSPAALEHYHHHKHLLQDLYGIMREEVLESKTSGHYHVIVTLGKRIDLVKRLLLQAALGSDGQRELLSLARHELHKEKEPSLLFRPKIYARILHETREID